MKTNRELFMEWLAKCIPSSDLYIYYSVIDDIENYAWKKHVFSGSLFDVVDSSISSELVNIITSDKLFKFLHKKQMKTIINFVQLFHKYTKENSLLYTGESCIENVAEIDAVNTKTISDFADNQDDNKLESTINDYTSPKGNIPIIDDKISDVSGEKSITVSAQPVSNTIPQNSEEKFTSWLEQAMSLSSEDRKILSASIHIAQLFLQENILPEFDLFAEDPNVINDSINALFSDPLFKSINNLRQNRYFHALEKLCDFYARKGINLDAISLFCGEKVPENAETEEALKESPQVSNSVWWILKDNNIPFWKACKGYLFVEQKNIPDWVVRTVRQAYDVISITSIRRYGKDCWRIHIKEDESLKKVGIKQSDIGLVLSEEQSLYEDLQTDVNSEEVRKSGNKTLLCEMIKKEEEASIISLIENMHIPYIDKREQGGCLWVLGNKSLRDKIVSLGKKGYKFKYCYNGSKSTNWESAWYLDDKGGIQLQTIDDSNGQNVNTNQEEFEDASKLLSIDLLQFLDDDDMQLLRIELGKQGITTLEQFLSLNLWSFMNRNALYSIDQRITIFNRIKGRLNNNEPVDRDSQYKLETRTTVFYGNSPAEAFLHFCEAIAQKNPMKFRSLIGVKYRGQGSVVLSRLDPYGNSLKMNNPEAYIWQDLKEEATIVYGEWICEVCGDKDLPEQIIPGKGLCSCFLLQNLRNGVWVFYPFILRLYHFLMFFLFTPTASYMVSRIRSAISLYSCMMQANCIRSLGVSRNS